MVKICPNYWLLSAILANLKKFNLSRYDRTPLVHVVRKPVVSGLRYGIMFTVRDTGNLIVLVKYGTFL